MPGVGGAAQFVQSMGRQPSPAARGAIIVFLAVIAVPVALLVLAAGIISGVVYLVLSVASKLFGGVSGARSVGPPPPPGADDEGRRNVRVKS